MKKIYTLKRAHYSFSPYIFKIFIYEQTPNIWRELAHDKVS